MCLLVETIRIHNGRICRMPYHDERVGRARRALFGIDKRIDLRSKIEVPSHLKTGRVKCRILYDAAVKKVEYTPYSVREIQKVSVVYSDRITYPHKYAVRNELEDLKKGAGPVDEIIIVKDGLVTDAYYYNIVVRSGGTYVTPERPLLPGIMRAYLLKKGRIATGHISVEKLMASDEVFFVNAMTDLGEIRLHPSQITGALGR